eukprot:scaffold169956_cov17-Tisochrysis_lutea.AAC.1
MVHAAAGNDILMLQGENPAVVVGNSQPVSALGVSNSYSRLSGGNAAFSAPSAFGIHKSIVDLTCLIRSSNARIP